MTSLLDILREIEPDAGWEAVGAHRDYCRTTRDGAELTESADLTTRVCVMSLQPLPWRVVRVEHEDVLVALRMALAGYRAGEK